MMQNKIIIGDINKSHKNETKPVLHETGKHQITDAGAKQETEQIPVDENVWGNDYAIINRLDERQLADRRLYVRVRYMQRIECNTASDSIEEEPDLLEKPIVFIISDLSMGGIGIICDNEISIGKILVIQLALDNIPYEIKCEVSYCTRNDDKFRAGLKIVQKDRQFIRHLKILVARISLNSQYGESYDSRYVDPKTSMMLIKLKQKSS